jgi:hypothetical protein
MDQVDQEYPFHWPQADIAHYTAYRVSTPPTIDGRLDEACWAAAPRSPRFVDLISGGKTIHDTRAALLWDDRCLYVAWVEEPMVQATLTARDSYIWEDNDVELFIAGRDAYYELEINSFGTIFEAFYVWEEAYAGYAARPEFARDAPGLRPFNGVGFSTHPRGPRLGFWAWDFPGLAWAVQIDGTLNQDTDRDRGWTVELALPWAGMQPLAQADGRSLPRATATRGGWTFRALTRTAKRRRPTIPAVGPGAHTGFGIRMCRKYGRSSTFPRRRWTPYRARCWVPIGG